MDAKLRANGTWANVTPPLVLGYDVSGVVEAVGLGVSEIKPGDEAIVRRLAARPGETVLIHGGAGGVSSFAVQIAKAAGARVLATASTANQEVLRRLGADVAIDYTKDDATEGGAS